MNKHGPTDFKPQIQPGILDDGEKLMLSVLLKNGRKEEESLGTIGGKRIGVDTKRSVILYS